ncbi:hypothetical protein BVC93_26775 [Mycobacterium sp. MS1601]|uniref:hypothetical protein n=1 Tax=Mycobacterium sp. MS1601 TaxID=1936029 RepID=UPI0009796329|nr:hypothetical protein [Mycobacterium sp. MS1601]AQA05392.1 hypothetical protein BVC93_26775 [Mycobacterium sp. MS1601]
MVRIHTRSAVWSAALGALGAAAFLGAAPSASAEPAPVIPVPAPAPVVGAPAPLPGAPAPLAAPAPLPGAPAPLPGAPAPLAAPLPPAEVQHLSSPENLPPGASLTPTGPQQSSGVSYLRELWHAVQTQEVSKADAVLLLTQRPMNADTPPPMGVPAGPQAPLPPAPVPLPVDPMAAPAPAPVPPPA